MNVRYELKEESQLKKKIVKAISLVMAVAMMAAAATGCSSSQSNSSTAQNPTVQSSAVQSSGVQSSGGTATGEKTKLTLWHIQTTDPVKTTIQNSIDRFMKDNPNYDVTVVPIANDAYKQKLTIAMSSGKTPDIYISWTGGPMIEYIKSNHCADITEYMNKDGYKDKFMDAAISQATYDSKIYAVPIENVSVAGFFYNKDLFAKYNLQEPKTISDLEKICQTLKTNGVTPFTLANATKWTGSMYYMYLATRFGGTQPFIDAASGKASFESEPFAYAGTQIQKWVKAGYFNQGFNGMDDDSGQARQLLYTGKAAMDLMGSWFSSTVYGENKDFMSKLGFFPFPALDGKESNGNLVVGTVGDNFYSVPEECKDKEAAFKAITYLLDDKAVEERTTAGKIIPFKDFKATDALTQKIVNTVNAAPSIQLWYDQYLPPEVAEVHKSTSQEIFGLTKTPEQADTELQAAMKTYLDKNK
jgi:raffinose/stachyose/melibiose transport system substrate-binding protein